MSKFVRPLASLHVHSSGSMLDGASSPKQHIDFCIEQKIPGMALTDHGTMCLISEFCHYAATKGIVGIPGCELYVDLEPSFRYGHLTVWALNERGFKTLTSVSSRAYKHKVTSFGQPKPRVTWQDLQNNIIKGDIAVGTGCCVGVCARPFLNGNEELATINLEKLITIFGKENVYAEAMFHQVTHDYNRDLKQFLPNPCTPISPDGDIQKSYNYWILQQAKKYDLKTIVSDDSHFVYPEEKVKQTALLQNGDKDGWHFYNTYSRQTADESFAIAEKTLGITQKQFEGMLDTNLEVIEKARNFKMPYKLVLPPVYTQDRIEVTDNSSYEKICFEKMRKFGRMNDDPIYKERLELELKIIGKNDNVNFLPYFIFLAEVCQFAKENGIVMGPTRGSAGGSLLSYWLGITHLDPIKLKLPFERFLSIDRINRKKFPDIDLDFDASRRQEIIDHLKNLYGDCCAQVGTHSTIGLKQALQDASRAIYGKVTPEVYGLNQSLKSAPQGLSTVKWLYGYTDDDGINHPGYMYENEKLNTFLKQHDRVANLVEQMVGIERQFGRHAGGFVVADKPIYEYIPTAIIGKKDESYYITQYTKDWVEKSGLVKMDLLGVNTLADIGRCLDILKKQDIHLDIYNLPEDSEVFKIYHSGDTMTVFQMEPGTTCHYDSKNKRSWLKDMKPDSVADLAAITALIRPGALDAIIEDGMTTAAAAYIDRKNGASFKYLHPDLEPILKDTYGLMVYQESVMQVFMDLAGYTMEKADVVREGIGKKKQDVVDQAKKDLEKSLFGRDGWTKEKIDILCHQIQAFARYAFNKSHAAGYGMLSYISAYLKVKHPLEWWSAVLQNAKKEEIKEDLWTHVKNFIVLPSVNHSNDNFIIKGDKILAPLRLIHGIGPAAYRELTQKAPYASLEDLVTKVDGRTVKLDTWAALAFSGALRPITDKGATAILEWYCNYKKREFPTYLTKFNKLDYLHRVKKHLPMLPVDLGGMYEGEMKKLGYDLADANMIKNHFEFIGKKKVEGDTLFSFVTTSAESGLKLKLKNPLAEDIHIAFMGIISDIKYFNWTSKKDGTTHEAKKYVISTKDESICCVDFMSKTHHSIGDLVLVDPSYNEIREGDRDYLNFTRFKFTTIDKSTNMKLAELDINEEDKNAKKRRKRT